MRTFCEEFGERKKVQIDFMSHDLPSLVQPEDCEFSASVRRSEAVALG